ncbi:cell division inhibition protein DicB, partial [Escherichia coli]
DRNRSHWSTSKTPSYTKSVSWQHHQDAINKRKQERELLNKICIVSMLARLRLMPKGCAQ